MRPIIKGKFLLEKFEGKGGWTYARLPKPELPAAGTKPFGWKKVMGAIDGYAIHKYHLMPMSDGNLMLPVKAEIRKHIGKQAGSYIQVELYPDDTALEIPGELLLCLEDEPAALRFFNSLSESEKKYYIQWIYSAKKEETKANRIARAIGRLSQELKMYDVLK